MQETQDSTHGASFIIINLTVVGLPFSPNNYLSRHTIVIVIGLRLLTEAIKYMYQVFIQYNYVSHLLQAAVILRPPLPQPLKTLQMDTSSSNSYRQHSNSLVLSRGDNPKDKSGLLDVKKGMDSAWMECCVLID